MLQEQAFNIAQIALLGVVLGMLIDMYRVVAGMLNPGKYLAGLFDLLFWLSCTLWAFVYLLRVNSGEARLYVLALLILGLALQQQILGSTWRTSLRSVLRALVKGLSRIISAVSIFLEAMLNIITAPFRFIVRTILRPTIWLIGLVFRPIRFMVRRLRTMNRAVRVTVAKWWAGEEPKEL